MKIEALPSALAGSSAQQFLTSYLVEDVLAIDAGSLGFYRGPEQQRHVRHVLLSHAHMDHIASLPTFLDNVCGDTQCPVTLHGAEEVLETLRRDILNDRIWPDFVDMTGDHGPLVRLQIAQEFIPFEVEGFQVTPLPMWHSVPCLGYLVADSATAVLVCSDSGPTDAPWSFARKRPELKAVFLECSFPDEEAALAERSRHLTPTTFAGEMDKLARPDVQFLAVHLKPRYRQLIENELAALGRPQVLVTEPGRPYFF